MEKLVIVESPTKAKTIKKFLPESYTVAASMGHIRDLPKSAAEIPENLKKQEWVQIGVNYNDDFQPIYVVPTDKKKVVADLKKKLSSAKELILATDLDREGESISWHLQQVLAPKVPVRRMVFHEITARAIKQALSEQRDIDTNLVQAQEARRILDRLVGYTLSPLLWKKIAVGLSAGRVQSVALRQIVLREKERIEFKRAEFWNIKADFEKVGRRFEAELTVVDDKRVANGKSFDEKTGKLKDDNKDVVLNGPNCGEIIDKIKNTPFTVDSIESRQVEKKPPPPFTTSALQQEGGRKLGLSSRDTMRVAQSLYEKGYITYMRTDSVNISDEALKQIRDIIPKKYSANYLNNSVRTFASGVKNAQEAHEAIRPAGQFTAPDKTDLEGRERALYEMIWKRTVATQMASAKITYMTVQISNNGYSFRASGKKIDFKGFFTLYFEDNDDESGPEDQETVLPEMHEGETLSAAALTPLQHSTQPRARFTEAALISLLEKEGIGRPSTYATIISTIIDRKYVTKVQNQLVPSFTAFAVTNLLEDNFADLVNTGFTAKMEGVLDDIAKGRVDYRSYLRDFCHGNSGLLMMIKDKTAAIEPGTYRRIKLKTIESDILLGRFGPFMERETEDGSIKISIPEDVFPGDINQDSLNELFEMKKVGGNAIGVDPETKQNIYVLNGKFGPFVQLGEVGEGKSKPKRVPLLKSMKMQDVSLETAHRLISLPLKLGRHPEGGEVSFTVGRYGPYVQHLKEDNSKEFRSVKDDEFMTINLARALELLSVQKSSARGSTMLKQLGIHPDTEKEILLYKGPYGKFIKYAGKNYALGKVEDPESLGIDECLAIISKNKSGKAKAASAKKTTATKKTASAKKTVAAKAAEAPKAAAKNVPAKPKLRKKNST